MLEGIFLKYDGRDAGHHVIEARHLGSSLIGVDRIVNDSLVLLTTGRAPKRGERYTFYVVAKEPRAGSVEILTALQNAPLVLPLVHEFVVNMGAEYVQQFLSWVLCWHGGRKGEAIEHMEQMNALVAEMNRSHEAQTTAWQSYSLAVIEKLKPAARQIVEPIGRSASSLAISGGSIPATTIDEPMAEAIRSREEIELTDMEQITFRIDGITKHNRQLRVEFPGRLGSYVSAEVRDPIFDTDTNPYIDAFAAGSWVRVEARRALRSGALYKLYVMNFVGTVDV